MYNEFNFILIFGLLSIYITNLRSQCKDQDTRLIKLRRVIKCLIEPDTIKLICFNKGSFEFVAHPPMDSMKELRDYLNQYTVLKVKDYSKSSSY